LLRPLVDELEIKSAYTTFSQNVISGGEASDCVIGYKGDSESAQLVWHADKKLWVFLEPERLTNRFWCAYGVDNPLVHKMVSITCEINPPRFGYNRRLAGLFVVDSKDTIYLAHSGKIGGGRKGIGKTAFMKSRDTNDIISVMFPDKRETDYILIGGIEDKDFLSSLAKFVHEISDFKHETVHGQ